MMLNIGASCHRLEWLGKPASCCDRTNLLTLLGAAPSVSSSAAPHPKDRPHLERRGDQAEHERGGHPPPPASHGHRFPTPLALWARRSRSGCDCVVRGKYLTFRTDSRAWRRR